MCRNTFRSYLLLTAIGRCVEIKSSAHDVQFRVLIMHCRPHVSMAHGAHDRREISYARQDACSIVVPQHSTTPVPLVVLPHFGLAETSCRSISGTVASPHCRLLFHLAGKILAKKTTKVVRAAQNQASVITRRGWKSSNSCSLPVWGETFS